MSDRVSAWLQSLGLAQYAGVFEEHAIDWELLPELDQETLKDIGVDTAGHRLRILKAANGLAQEGSPFAAETESEAVSTAGFPAPQEEETATWSRTPGELKPVTMLFADIVGSTNLTEKLDAEEAHALLYRATQLMCESVEQNRGTVCRFMGDGIMAMFGAPIASERHALEACRAAIDMQAAVTGYAAELETRRDAGLQIRVGLNSGEVVVLEVGDDPDHPEYDASGPTVPLASRMEQSARAGTILITGLTQALAGELVDCRPLPDIEVKGLSEPVEVCELTAIRSATKPADSQARQPFVGRKAELAQFRGLMDSCLEGGHGQTICVRGEAGIGKTRLVEEMTQVARGRSFDCHKALVLDFGAGKGQEAIPSMVRSLLGIAQSSNKAERKAALEQAENSGVANPDGRVFLNDLLDLKQPLELRTLYDAMDPQARKEGKRAAIIQLMKNLAQTNPVFIVVEDLHWADDITLNYLARLTGAVAECPALMAFTSRVEGYPLDSTWRAVAAEAPIVTWDLSPLRTEEAAKLVSDFIDASDSLAKRCIERAAGNPLFLKQLLLSVEKGSADSVPDSIKSLVLSRMDQLSNPDKLALQAASVLGQRFELEALRFLVEANSYECLELVERHLLRPEGSLYLFAHALIQEGAYSSLLKQQRIEWHQRAAAWYRQRDLVLHAEHLDYAGDAAAPGAYCAAAREQFARYRPERALQLVRAGLKIASAADGFDLECLEGELLRILGSTPESIAAYESAAKLAGNDVELCRALVGLAEGLEIAEEHEQLMEVLGRAERLATHQSLAPEMAKILRLRAGVYFFKSEKEACLATSNAALEYARRADSNLLVARALSGVGDAEYNRGNFDAAFRHFDQCIEMARQYGLGTVLAANLSMRGFISHYRNDFVAKEADYEEALDLAIKSRDLRSEFITLSGGNLWAEMGDIDKGLEWLERGIAIVRKVGSQLFEGEYNYLFARIECMRGDFERARAYARDAVTSLRQANAGMSFRGPTALGIYASTLDDPDLRREVLQEAEVLLNGDVLSHNHLDFPEDAMFACLRAGDWNQVDRYAQMLEDYMGPRTIPRCKLVLDRGRALAAYGRGDRDPEVFAKLRNLHDEASRVRLTYLLPEIEAALRGA